MERDAGAAARAENEGGGMKIPLSEHPKMDRLAALVRDLPNDRHEALKDLLTKQTYPRLVQHTQQEESHGN